MLPFAVDSPDPADLPAGLSTTGRTGAANELRASAHLMHQGFDVFRCVAPTAPFDLVAHRDGQLYRVEVKTLTVIDGHLSPQFSWPANDQWDLLIACNASWTFQFPAGTSKFEARDKIRKAMNLTYRDPATPPRRLPSEREALILKIFAEASGATWSAVSMRHEMQNRGWQFDSSDPSKVVAGALRYMTMRGLLQKVAIGMYQMPGADND